MTKKQNQSIKDLSDNLIQDFSQEWKTFDQSKLTLEEKTSYFKIFPWKKFQKDQKGLT